jgi:hypothetical protein
MSSFKEELHMGSKLYVGGLPYSVTEQQLNETFGAHGTVASARIISDKFTGQSRGLVSWRCPRMLRRKPRSRRFMARRWEAAR